MTTFSYVTRGGVRVTRRTTPADYATATESLIDRLDAHQGALLSSNYEYPGRYTRWEFGFADPPLRIEARGRDMVFLALNRRGSTLLRILEPALAALGDVERMSSDADRISLSIRDAGPVADEEARSRAPSVFTALRAVSEHFHSGEDGHLGLYGAFGYDLAFQFDPIELKRPRPEGQRDLALFHVDSLVVADHYTAEAHSIHYDFALGGHDTSGVDGGGASLPFAASKETPPRGDHSPGEYADLVRLAKDSFARGDLFEVVPGQVFHELVHDSPAAVYRRLRRINPAPFGFLMNLGESEYLVGASPEMFVRVTGRRVETCPISGTIKRGRDAIEDAEQILALLKSEKDESELTMCSDVDRNDKSRVCEPGSVRVIGRRQIEMYSRLIHTVDHIEGRLREGMDAYDAFLSHAWAVTVTGAPKLWAMRFIEEHEKSPRAWYGGAIGAATFDGNMNTGLTLRTIRIIDGRAEVRAGATLLFDSDPEAEEAETELKASAMRAAIRGEAASNADATGHAGLPRGAGRRALLVDHEDSFVHTLANYLRQTGAEVRVTRSPVSGTTLDEFAPDLVMLSPGPGAPSDFDCSATVRAALDRGMAVFGVCLGLQAIGEHFGAELRQLAAPAHGKPSRIDVVDPGILFEGLPREIAVGRYHSLHLDRATIPGVLKVTALTSDGVVMAIEHRDLPVAAVQFHPESIMSLGRDAGFRIVENAVAGLGAGLGGGAGVDDIRKITHPA